MSKYLVGSQSGKRESNRCPSIRAFVWMALTLFQGSVFAHKIPDPLCSILLLSGQTTKEQILEHFNLATSQVLINLPSELRSKLIASAVGMGAAKSPNSEQMRTTADDWGVLGVSFLWLLGVPEQRIREIVHAQLQEAYNVDFAAAEKVLAERQKINLDLGETASDNVKAYIDTAILAGDSEMAERFLGYLMLLNHGSDAAIYSLEKLGRQNDLLQLGIELASRGVRITSYNWQDRYTPLKQAVAALSRVTDQTLKKIANQTLLEIARYCSSDRLFEIFPHVDIQQESWDIALDALAATGQLSTRTYADSIKVKLQFRAFRPDEPQFSKHLNEDVDRRIRTIAEKYFQLTHRMHPSTFQHVRDALVSIGANDLLERFANELFERRKTWADSWFPAQVYETSFEYFLAAGNIEKARSVLRSLLDEFTIVDRLDRENRRTMEAGYMNDTFLDMATRAQDFEMLKRLSRIADDRGWLHIAEKIAAAQAEEQRDLTYFQFPRRPEIEEAIGKAISEEFRTRDGIQRHHDFDRERQHRPSIELGWKLVEKGSFESLNKAQEIFMMHGSPEGMIAVGDGLMKIHYEMATTSGPNYAAGAHGAYLAAAIFLEVTN